MAMNESRALVFTSLIEVEVKRWRAEVKTEKVEFQNCSNVLSFQRQDDFRE